MQHTPLKVKFKGSSHESKIGLGQEHVGCPMVAPRGSSADSCREEERPLQRGPDVMQLLLRTMLPLGMVLPVCPHPSMSLGAESWVLWEEGRT